MSSPVINFSPTLPPVPSTVYFHLSTWSTPPHPCSDCSIQIVDCLLTKVFISFLSQMPQYICDCLALIFIIIALLRCILFHILWFMIIVFLFVFGVMLFTVEWGSIVISTICSLNWAFIQQIFWLAMFTGLSFYVCCAALKMWTK